MPPRKRAHAREEGGERREEAEGTGGEALKKQCAPSGGCVSHALLTSRLVCRERSSDEWWAQPVRGALLLILLLFAAE